VKRVLVSGFEPFAGNNLNPTKELVLELQEGPSLKCMVLPVSFERSWEVLHQSIKEFNPHWVVSCGVAAKRETIDFERVALNLIDARIKDNDGKIIEETKISSTGSEAYISDLPLNDWRKKLEKDFPINVSLSAGSYVCNYLYYKLMEHQAELNYHSLFIHFPYPSEALPIEKMGEFLQEFLLLIDQFDFE